MESRKQTVKGEAFHSASAESGREWRQQVGGQAVTGGREVGGVQPGKKERTRRREREREQARSSNREVKRSVAHGCGTHGTCVEWKGVRKHWEERRPARADESPASRVLNAITPPREGQPYLTGRIGAGNSPEAAQGAGVDPGGRRLLQTDFMPPGTPSQAESSGRANPNRAAQRRGQWRAQKTFY
ncbi:hypothetical protein B0H11DRAFT_2236077 [Mycena galericulata]|nr:hypothetical protein B0H11DRAFT_2236077 [Mycena galericulata]